MSLTGRRSYLAIDWPVPPLVQRYQTATAATVSRAVDNEIPLDQYRQGPHRINNVDYRSGSSQQQSGPIQFQFVNELGQPVPMNYKQGGRAASILRPVEQRMQRMTSASNHNHSHRKLQSYSVEFQVRPLSERGLLVYVGAFEQDLDDGLGFVSLTLQGGVVEFRVSDGGGRQNHRVTVLRSNRMLAIGEWHKIRFAQHGRRLSLWVEGSAVSATTGADFAGLTVPEAARIYFGGLPDLSHLPAAAISGFPVPYRGCIRQVVVSGTRVVLNETNIIGECMSDDYRLLKH